MRLTISVPDHVAASAREMAATTSRSVSSLVSEAIQAYLAAERRRLAAARIDALIGEGSIVPEADDILAELRREPDGAAG